MLARRCSDIRLGADFSFLLTKRTCSWAPERLNCLSRSEMLELGSTVIDVKRRHRW